MPDISIVIPTYNRKELLKRCIDALLNQTLYEDKYEIIIVDDGSNDGTEDLVRNMQEKSKVTLRYTKQSHRGVAAARNLGIKNAISDIIAFTDDDCISNKDWLEKILEAFKEHPEALGVGGKTLSIPEKITPFTHQVINLSNTNFPNCNVAYKKGILKQVGGLDEIFIHYSDDADLTLKVLKRGKIIHAPGIIIVHPPRKVSFLNELKKMKYWETEFMLYERHPEEYKKTKRHPLWELIAYVGIRMFLSKSIKNLKWLFKNPYIYVKFVILLILQRLYLLILIPIFIIRYIIRRLKK